jgi:dephospho-CoA kinase
VVFVKILGITGGMGSGKTTVANYLKDKGAAVIDADELGREVLKKGTGAFDETKEAFGQRIFGTDGEINRKKLGDIVFKDKEKLKKLNDITHKFIIEKINLKIDELKNDKNISMIVIDAAIPVKRGFIDVTDEIWAVITDRESRIQRIMGKSDLTYYEAVDRIDAQPSDSEYTNIADKIITNNEDIYELKIKVAEMLQDISK